MLLRNICVISACMFSRTLFAAAPTFTLHLDDLQQGKLQEQHILSADYGFGCYGGNQSPALSWHGAPEGTKSFVLSVYDPDAPTGLGWIHWEVVNIPADVKQLAGGIRADGQQLPAGALQTRTDFGQAGYGGPCPPEGDKPHRYVFTLTALDIEKLPNVTQDSMPALVGFFTHAHALASASVTVTYQREKP
ncbi:MAG: YbhB/YbcL family Raf kinase inhibitor-like protein [Cardiobacteriaceae bacterium]|nr:YbhB/YbcL family Raf kinase inhibitor-like protein [Cardiobacteriaceae bacterium]